MLNEVIITNTTTKNKSYWANLPKKDKILQIRKKNNSVLHDYYAMAEKYKSWDKMMFTFTVPNSVRCKTRSIKNSKYTKLRELIKIKASLAKLLSRESGIKYFANIELGEKYSNPHLHLQLYCEPSLGGTDVSLGGSVTSSTTANLIRNKIITKYNLNPSRCSITLPETNTDKYTYVVKDYSKFLSDEDVWNLDVQKKRFRSALRSKVRFISKSGDKYTKRIYKKLYWSYSILRGKADLFLDKLLETFFFFNKRKLPLVRSFVYVNVILSKERTSKIVFVSYIWLFDLLFVSPAASPPFLFLFYYLFKLKGDVMFLLIVFIGFVLEFLFRMDCKCRSPPLELIWVKVLFFSVCYNVIKI